MQITIIVVEILGVFVGVICVIVVIAFLCVKKFGIKHDIVELIDMSTDHTSSIATNSYNLALEEQRKEYYRTCF